MRQSESGGLVKARILSNGRPRCLAMDVPPIIVAGKPALLPEAAPGGEDVSAQPRFGTTRAQRRLLLAPSLLRPTPSACMSITLPLAGRVPAAIRHAPRVSPSRMLVRPRLLPDLTAYSIKRSRYEDAGAGMDHLGDEGDARGTQKHTGGAEGKGGRQIGSRRFTRETLSTVCRRAMAMALLQYGAERFSQKLMVQATHKLSAEALSDQLSAMSAASCRGEVWPLRHIFGFFSKCVGGLSGVAGERDESCTWVGRNGFVNCSCQGRTRLLSVMRRPEGEATDINCTHGLAMLKSLRKFARVLGVDLRALRSTLGHLHTRCSSRLPSALDGDGVDDGDCERFVVGQSVFGIAVTGHGDGVVAAPVRFTRLTTTCMLCDTARTAACAHVSLTRHFKRTADARDQSGAAKQGKQADTEQKAPADKTASTTDDAPTGREGTAYSEADVVQSVSQKPIGLFNCHRSTVTDAGIGELVAKGGTYRISAPACCRKCSTPRGAALDIGSTGVILCSAGPCPMRLEAYLCPSTKCGEWVSADGGEQGVVIYTAFTAATSVLMRQWAFALVLDGTTYASSYETWRRSYLDRRDAGKASACHIRAKQTINKVFNAAVRLMTDNPPQWAFTCGTCQDEDGRFRVVTADGIWLGFLRRLASKPFSNPCQPCVSVSERVRAGSLCGSEAVRRFIRLSLKQPGREIVINTGQLPSAERALFFLCPAALPADRVPACEEFEKSKLESLYALLDSVWELKRSAIELARGIVKRIRHVLTNEIANSRPAHRVASDVATAAHIREWLDTAVAAAVDTGLDDGLGNEVSDGGSSSGHDTPPPRPRRVARPAPHRRRGRRRGEAGGAQRPGGLPAAAVRAGREAAAARRHHENVTVAEPSDPRCLRPAITGLGADQYKPITSFCVALATDAVVNAFKPRHVAVLESVAGDLEAPDAGSRVDMLLGAACNSKARTQPGLVGNAPPSDSDILAASKARVVYELRLLMACLVSMRFNEPTFERLRRKVAAALRSVCATVTDYHLPREGEGGDRTALEFGTDWLDPSLSPSELRERFRARFPHTSDDAMVTGCFFPGLSQCRPGPFAAGEQPELGMCAKHYQAIRKFFSPGTFTVCCACPHPKLIGFVVLEKREGPYALLNAIITRFALLPHFIVYDFGCGALRSALGKLPLFVAIVVIISDLFHIVNHVCSDIFNPRSYSPMDGKNTVAHEQRNSPIAAMMKTLRACGQDEYMRIMKLHTIVHNVHAHARSTCTYPLPDDYNFRKFYFSRQTCACGCGQAETEPPLPSPPSSVPSTPTISTSASIKSSNEEQ